MRQIFSERFLPLFEGYLPKVVGALGILVLGWLIALLVAALVRAALRRTTLDNRIARWLAGEPKAKELDVERGTSRVVFWIIMLLTLVGFFQVLGLTQVIEPLNRFLGQIFEFLPQLLSAVILLLLAWAVATALRFAVRRALQAARVDERLGEETRGEGKPRTERVSLTQTLGETVYWLVFLLFLPAVLDALALRGLMTPVVGLLDKVLAFLPNLLASALILVVGWFVARIVRRIVANLLAAAGLDRFGERVGLSRVLGEQPLSGVVGLVLYVLILVPVLIAALNALALDAITQPASQMLDKILAALPALFAAVLLLIVAYVLGRIVAGLATNLLNALGFDNALERLGFGKEKVEGKRPPSEIVGTVVVIVVMLFASIEALELLEFGMLAGLLTAFTVFLGKVVLALAVFALGLYLANLAGRTIRASATPQSGVLATAARVAIIVLAGAMALGQLDVAQDIINLAFGILLGAIAVAAAIAFGIGGRDIAARYLDRWLPEAKKAGK